MNDITGADYSSAHNWEDKGTEQSNFPPHRSTLFVCKDCGEAFRHYYHMIENIYDAMRNQSVNKTCNKKENI